MEEPFTTSDDADIATVAVAARESGDDRAALDQDEVAVDRQISSDSVTSSLDDDDQTPKQREPLEELAHYQSAESVVSIGKKSGASRATIGRVSRRGPNEDRCDDGVAADGSHEQMKVFPVASMTRS